MAPKLNLCEANPSALALEEHFYFIFFSVSAWARALVLSQTQNDQFQPAAAGVTPSKCCSDATAQRLNITAPLASVGPRAL